MPDPTMQVMDNKILEFKKFIDEFSKMFEQGHLSVNMWKTQHAQLRALNEQWTEKNRLAEEQLNNTVSANEKLKDEGQAFYDKKKADAMVLYSKAHAKFKEVERFIDEADKRRLKSSLKELEAVAA